MTSNEELKSWLEKGADDLTEAVVSDVHEHVESLKRAGVPFYGYALMPNDYWTQDLNAIHAAYSLDTEIESENRSDPYYRYSVDEWRNYVSEGFNRSNEVLRKRLKTLNELYANEDEEDDFIPEEFSVPFVNATNQAILDAMLTMRQKGTFAPDTYLIIWYSDSGDPIIGESAKALNSPDIYKQFASVFG